MIASGRNSGGFSICFRFFLPAVFILFLGGFLSSARTETLPYKVEIRLTEDWTLQLLDNRGKIWQTLGLGSVRKRVIVQNIPLLASFGRDSQHRLIIMLAMDPSLTQPLAFLFENNIIVQSPEASLTFQVFPNQSHVEVTPSLAGKIWINGNLLSRGETTNLRFHPARKSGSEIIPNPDQPKPSMNDFQAIPPPSI